MTRARTASPNNPSESFWQDRDAQRDASFVRPRARAAMRAVKVRIVDVALSVVILTTVIAFYLIPLALIWMVCNVRWVVSHRAGVLVAGFVLATLVGALALGV